MASALMRRSAMTALLAAVATVASPLAGISWAATALGAPTSVSPTGTDKETQPTATFTYAAPVDTSQSSITIVDTSASNAPVPCTLAFTNSNKTIQCAVSQDLVDKHSYKATASVVNAADPTDAHTSANADSTTWTTDIPSEVAQVPANGEIDPSLTTFNVTFDEWISTDPTKITVDLVNSAGHHVQSSGHTSGSDTLTTGGAQRGTATWTSDVGGLAPSTYTAHFRVFSPSSPADMTSSNPSDWGTATITFTVDSTLPPDKPYDVVPPANITQANVTAVPFTGYAPPGFTVKVAIYDETADSGDAFGPHPEGTGRNDSLGSAVTPSCSDSVAHTSPNDVRLCPFTVDVDATNSPDTGSNQTVQGAGKPYQEHLQWYAYTWTAAGQKPDAACPSTTSTCTADPEIFKDTQGPDAPSGQTAQWNKNTNTVTVSGGGDANTTGDLSHYLVKITDQENNLVARDNILPTAPTNSFPTTTIDVSALNDGLLTVNVYGVDSVGNLSAPFNAQPPPPTSATIPTLTKESTPTAPALDTTHNTLTAAGVTYNFTCAQSSSSCHALTPTTRVNTPTSVTVYFNEPIKVAALDDSDPSNPGQPWPGHASEICLDDSSGPGSCLNHGVGTTTVSSDFMSLTWTAPAGFSLPSDTYDVSAFAVSKDNCPNKTKASSSCDMSVQPGTALTSFVIDQTAPTITFTNVPATIDGNTVKAATFGGKASGDTTNVTLTIKSSGGGSARVFSVNTTPTSDGNGTIDWSTTQDLSALPDGTLSLTATGTDGANNRTSAANAATASSVLQARPTAPQNLTASAGNGQAVLSWVAPASTGGVPLTGYSLGVTDTSVPGSATATFPVDGSALTYTVNGLANGHTYSFALTAANSIGSGPAATTSATPKGNTALSVVASRGTITYGQFLVVNGTLTYAGVGVASEPVTVTTVYYNGSHGPTYHVTTDQYGQWVVAGLSPAKNVTYVATFGGDSAYNASSGAAKVFVRVLIRIAKVSSANSSHLTKVKLTGNVRPSQASHRVYLYEVLAHGKLRYLGYAKLSSKSTWAFAKAFAKGRHTVVARFLSQNGNVGNWSNRVRFSRS